VEQDIALAGQVIAALLGWYLWLAIALWVVYWVLYTYALGLVREHTDAVRRIRRKNWLPNAYPDWVLGQYKKVRSDSKLPLVARASWVGALLLFALTCWSVYEVVA